MSFVTKAGIAAQEKADNLAADYAVMVIELLKTKGQLKPAEAVAHFPNQDERSVREAIHMVIDAGHAEFSFGSPMMLVYTP